MTEETSPCYKCNQPTPTEYFCYGCAQVICGDCNMNENLMGEHIVDDHLEPTPCCGDRVDIDGTCASCGERPKL